MFLCDICYKDVKSVVVPLFDDKEYEWFAFPLACELCNRSKTDWHFTPLTKQEFLIDKRTSKINKITEDVPM